VETFIRIAANEENNLEEFDKRNSSGRSAYICPQEACIEKALKKDGLARTLKRSISEEAKARLKNDLLCRLR
jgi:predicted RNA-binding protein YlxR (DUF448 family)